MSQKKTIRLGITLKDEMKQRFLAIKKKWGLESNADVVRMLITMEYDRIMSKT